MDDKLALVTSLDEKHGLCTMKLTGPLVLSNMFDFQQRLREEKSRGLIIDLSEVPYIDSAGIGVLILLAGVPAYLFWRRRFA